MSKVGKEALIASIDRGASKGREDYVVRRIQQWKKVTDKLYR